MAAPFFTFLRFLRLYENIKDDYPYNSLLLALQILEERDNEDWDF